MKLKQKWTRRVYGHDEVVDIAVLSAPSMLVDKKSPLRMLAFALFGLAVGAVFFLAVDGMMLAHGRLYFATVERQLLQEDWALNIGHKNTIKTEKIKSFPARQISYDEFSRLPDQFELFSRNSFRLPENKGFVYLIPTNIAGRIFFPLAKRVEVAIILRTPFDFKLPDGVEERGINVVAHKRMNRLGLSLFKLDLPISQWDWVSRFMTRKAMKPAQ